MSGPNLTTPLTSIEEGKAWLKALHDADMAFHLEDDPGDIIRGSTGEPLFYGDEAEHVRLRVSELYGFDWVADGFSCPLGYLVHLEGDEA